jgi:hypothetical protein
MNAIGVVLHTGPTVASGSLAQSCVEEMSYGQWPSLHGQAGKPLLQAGDQ